METAWALGGLVIGAVMAFVFMRQAQKPNEARFQDAVNRISELEREVRDEGAKLAATSAELAESRGEAARLQATIEERDRSHEEKLQAYSQAESLLKDTFKALSGEALESSTKQLLGQAEEVMKRWKESDDSDAELRKKEIDSMLQPLKDRLKSLDEQNQQMERHRAGAYKELMEQVRSLGEGTVGLTKETTRLVRALQDPGTAGSWGEVALERVVEKAGLEEHVSYVTQESFEGEEGRQRPDMIVRLPGDRCLIIDSKAPMRSYIEALETEDADAKTVYLTDHANKLLGHAKDLKRRDYSKLAGSAPDFVVLFVGSEAAYHAAHSARKTLNEEVWDCNVVLASPNSLLGLLRAVNYGWQQERLASSAKQLQQDAATLYERICKIAGDYVQLGKSLSAAAKKYNEMGTSLESRVLPAARKFKDHGVQTNTEVAAIEPIDFAPRPLQSPELSGGDVRALPGIDD